VISQSACELLSPRAMGLVGRIVSNGICWFIAKTWNLSGSRIERERKEECEFIVC